jgi:hypothetical protein
MSFTRFRSGLDSQTNVDQPTQNLLLLCTTTRSCAIFIPRTVVHHPSAPTALKPFQSLHLASPSTPPSSMPSTWQRHPRYFIVVALIILATIYLANPYQHSVRPDSFAAYIRDNELPARLERAEGVYSKVIADRKEMIRKHGPTPRDILMYVDASHHESILREPHHLAGFHQIRSRGLPTPSVSAIISTPSPEPNA